MATATRKKAGTRKTAKKEAQKDLSVTYDQFKEFEGQRYTDKWSVSAKTQRKHLVAFLQELIAQLEKEPIPIEFEYNGKEYKGDAIPITQTCLDGVCTKLDVILNDEQVGIIRYLKSGWKIDTNTDKKFIKAIGQEILHWYNK